MKQHALSKATLILSVFWFLLPLHSWAQSQQYILLPFIFPPTATMQATNAKTPVEIGLGTVRAPSAQSFTVFDPPNATLTDSLSINANGDVTGYFNDGSLGRLRAFTRDPAGNITVFDAPNASFTVSTSINDGGAVTGYFMDASRSGMERGFVRDRRGNITVFDAPNSAATAPAGINSGGSVTGIFLDGGQNSKGRGFTRDPNGNITVFDAPNTSYTGPTSINAGGHVTGFFDDPNTSLGSHGFLRDQTGHITVFDPPTSVSTGSFGINAGGDVAGYFQYGSQGNIRGFTRDPNGNITAFDAPNSSFTYAVSINEGGDVTGMFNDESTNGSKLRGFVRQPDGNISVFDPNTAGLTIGRSINARGDVTGTFEDESTFGQRRGFVRKTGTLLPVTTATPSPGPNANGWNNTNVRIALRATDFGGPGVQQIQFSLVGAQNTGWQTVAGNAASVTISAEGTTILIYFATDNAGNQENAKILTVQIDKTRPAISGLPTAACTIWPPNHKLVKVAIVTATDALSGLVPASFNVTGTSNDPANGQIVISGAPNQFLVQLGADKNAAYTLIATATDRAGNTITQKSTCTVPHDQGH